MGAFFKWKSCMRTSVNCCMSFSNRIYNNVIRGFVTLLNTFHKMSIAKPEIGSRNEDNRLPGMKLLIFLLLILIFLLLFPEFRSYFLLTAEGSFIMCFTNYQTWFLVPPPFKVRYVKFWNFVFPMLTKIPFFKHRLKVYHLVWLMISRPLWNM